MTLLRCAATACIGAAVLTGCRPTAVCAQEDNASQPDAPAVTVGVERVFDHVHSPLQVAAEWRGWERTGIGVSASFWDSITSFELQLRRLLGRSTSYRPFAYLRLLTRAGGPSDWALGGEGGVGVEGYPLPRIAVYGSAGWRAIHDWNPHHSLDAQDQQWFRLHIGVSFYAFS